MAEIHAQQFQAILSAIETYENGNGNAQLLSAVVNCNSLSIEEAEQIVNAMVKAGIKFTTLLLINFLTRCQSHSLKANCVKNIFYLMEGDIVFCDSYFNILLNTCGEGSLDADCVKIVLEKKLKEYTFDENSLPKFLNACGENSLDGENLENLYHSCYEYLFKNCLKNEIDNKLTSETSKEFFQKLCDFHEIKKGKKRNKKLGIFGIVGITIGGLSGLAAIGLGAAVGIGALAVTIVAPIVFAVVGLALIGIFSYAIDRFRVNKVLNEIAEAKLNGQSINENEIQFDLRKREEIQDALAGLDESKKPLLQNVKGR